MPSVIANQRDGPPDWAGLIPMEDWRLYRRVLEAAQAAGIPFALGGGFAFSYYSHRWRDTKDIDLYILPRDLERSIAILDQAGFKDLHDQKPYDRKWIYRGRRDHVIADLIWAMANQRAQVDEGWLERGREITLHGLRLRVLPPEELIWAKLYVVQRDRCDWPDLLNIIHAQGPRLDWKYLLNRLEDDAQVLGGVMSLFSWISPARAAELPEWIWEPMGLRGPTPHRDRNVDHGRVALLDARDWFGPKKGEKGEAIQPRQE